MLKTKECAYKLTIEMQFYQLFFFLGNTMKLCSTPCDSANFIDVSGPMTDVLVAQKLLPTNVICRVRNLLQLKV